MEHAHILDLVAFLDADSKVGEAIDAALAGPVKDLPIDEPAVARQADAAGADAAQRKADLAGL